MGSFPKQLAADLRDPFGLKRAIETFGRAHTRTAFKAGETARGVGPPTRFTVPIHPLRAWVGRKLGR